MTRSRWIYINGEAIPADEATELRQEGTMIMPDIKPYRSMLTGEMVESRSKHRELLKAHGCIEVGNETKHLQPKPKKLPPGLKETLIRVVNERMR